ncbi:helix-turn-helix domain-containing protein [uncultured Roseobacter sp.]|uniref:winged helix-turn-helix transcriptional regulator n=1 Tax=uncultured Roseobacter sp. TaxID=114847 RepID=UPI002608FDE8|nr:helix-turn-helix domain-containing protein [uncultured Roseobacter sp.]
MEPLARDPDINGCPVTYCLSVIGGKWKPVILFCIANGVDRFGAMQRSVPSITKQMLTKQLRELEADCLISRKVFAEVPPRVDYSLTDVGRTVLPIIKQMEVWGQANMK